jgi:B12 binding domain
MSSASNESTYGASAPAAAEGAPRRILLAKTALDGHWRGISVVARALRDGGFQVILGGMSTGTEIVRAAIDEDVDLVGLNVASSASCARRGPTCRSSPGASSRRGLPSGCRRSASKCFRPDRSSTRS